MGPIGEDCAQPLGSVPNYFLSPPKDASLKAPFPPEAPLSLRFSARIEPIHVREATSGIFWKQTLQGKVLAGFGAFVAFGQLMIWVLVPQAGWPLHLFLAFLMSLSAWGMAWVGSRHYQELALENFKRIHTAPVQVSLEEDAYRFEAPWGKGAVSWAEFHSLWRFEGVWILLQHKEDGASVLLPTADLDEAARAFILGKFQGKA
jgi:hypothetical protein